MEATNLKPSKETIEKRRRREACYVLYRQGLPLAEVSRETGIDQGHLSKWRNHYDWDCSEIDPSIPGGDQRGVRDEDVAEEFYKLMRQDVLESARRLQRMKTGTDIDATLKRERIAELVEKRGISAIGHALTEAEKQPKTVINYANIAFASELLRRRCGEC